MPGFEYKILSSITQLDKKEWDCLFGDLAEGYGFYKTLEDSHLKDFTFYYLTLRNDKEAVLLLPLFITDFNLDIGVKGWFCKIIGSIRKIFPRFMILRTLFCGSPFGEYGVVPIKSGIEIDNLLFELNNALMAFCKKNNIALVVFKDFLTKDTPILDKLRKKGFFKVTSFPSVVTDINFTSFDEYLKTLSHATRKNIRRKLKITYASADIAIKITDNVNDIVDDVFRLYEYTYHKGATKFERLTRDFFINVARNMHPEARFFLYYCNEKLGAFNLCFCHRDTLIDKFIGFDYDIARKYNLYFLTWCYNVEWCLKNNIRYYQTGQTDYHLKIKMGGKLIPLYAYVKHMHPLMNSILKVMAIFLKPENFDRDIK